jgi:hypothetical protein
MIAAPISVKSPAACESAEMIDRVKREDVKTGEFYPS